MSIKLFIRHFSVGRASRTVHEPLGQHLLLVLETVVCVLVPVNKRLQQFVLENRRSRRRRHRHEQVATAPHLPPQMAARTAQRHLNALYLADLTQEKRITYTFH